MLAQQVASITVNRAAQTGTISMIDQRASQFGTPTVQAPRMEVQATFPGVLIQRIVSELDSLADVKEHSS
jgi:hypothetical protein